MMTLTDDGEILDVNVAAQRLLGRNREEILSAGRNEIFWDFRLREAVEKRRREGGFHGMLRVARGDGTTFEVEVKAVALEDEKVRVILRENNVESLEGFEKSPIKSFFKAFVENGRCVFLLSGGDGVISYASPSARRILGSEPEEIIGSELSERFHPEDREKVAAALSGGMSGESSRDIRDNFRLRHGGGEWVEVEGSIENLLEDEEIGGVVFVGGEATFSRGGGRGEGGFEDFEKKLEGMVESLEESERRLRESERLFRTTFDEAPVGVAHVGVDGRWVRVNKKLCEILGHQRQSLLGRTFQEITHSDDLKGDLSALESMLKGGRDSVSLEKRYVRGDLSSVWVSVSASLVRDEDGGPRYFICTIEDISRIKAAQLIAQSLSERETMVLKLLARGMTNREIAAGMNFSLSSAKVHVGRVIKKLEASDRTHAAVRAASLGLL